MVMSGHVPFGSDLIDEMEAQITGHSYDDDEQLDRTLDTILSSDSIAAEARAKLAFGKNYLVQLGYPVHTMSDIQILDTLEAEFSDHDDDMGQDDGITFDFHATTRHPLCA